MNPQPPQNPLHPKPLGDLQRAVKFLRNTSQYTFILSELEKRHQQHLARLAEAPEDIIMRVQAQARECNEIIKLLKD